MTYVLLSGGLKTQVEITPKFVNLTSLYHLLNDVDCIASLSLLTHVVPSENLGVGHLTHSLEMVDDPFVEMEAPVCQGVCQLCIGLAVSVESCMG